MLKSEPLFQMAFVRGETPEETRRLVELFSQCSTMKVEAFAPEKVPPPPSDEEREAGQGPRVAIILSQPKLLGLTQSDLGYRKLPFFQAIVGEGVIAPHLKPIDI